VVLHNTSMYALILFLFLLLAPLFYLRVIKEQTWLEIKIKLFPKYQGHRKELLGSLALFGALLLGFVVVAGGITLVEEGSGVAINDLDKVEGIITEEFTSNALLFIGIIIVGLFVEEFFFRSFLVPRIGMILSTLVFTALHAGYGSIAEVIGVFFLGLILAYWFKRNQSLLQNYLGHLLYDILAIALYLLI
jgi:membrane protease YdiL (CAAX protease family)